MKPYYCENCAFFDELKNEQPCCCCVDGINFVELEGEEQIMSKKQIEETAAELWTNTLICSEELCDEVAREIFEEIEKALNDNFHADCQMGDCIEDYYDCDLADDIAELKKKYTEGENGTQ